MNASDLVAAALDKRPSNFLKIFDELMIARAEALVGETKSAIAQGLVATEENVEVDEGNYTTVDSRQHNMMRDASRPFAVVSKDGKKVLSRHPTKELANKAAARRNKLTKEESETLNLGGYQPVPGAEKDFVSKHKVEKFADRTGNGDDVYKGKTKVAKYPRADRGGEVASPE